MGYLELGEGVTKFSTWIILGGLGLVLLGFILVPFVGIFSVPGIIFGILLMILGGFLYLSGKAHTLFGSKGGIEYRLTHKSETKEEEVEATPLEKLKQSLAEGKITTKEFRERKKLLEEA